jgi:hypothetical protein
LFIILPVVFLSGCVNHEAKKPELNISYPLENQTVNSKYVDIKGYAEPGSRVDIFIESIHRDPNDPVRVLGYDTTANKSFNSTGDFTQSMPLKLGINKIIIYVYSSTGTKSSKEITVTRN